MNVLNRIKGAYLWHVTYRIDKIINTFIWLLTPKDKVLVLNVWLWHRGSKVRSVNFGDDLNYAIISFLSKKKIISYMHSYVSLFKPRNYMCIGSIADTLTNMESVIWGSGAMYGDKNGAIVKPKEILAVRGPLTRDYFLSHGVSCPDIYGDPALLLPFIFPCPNVVKKYKIGLIPNYIDNSLQNIVEFEKKYEDKVIIIDMAHYKKWQDIVKLINECECIASSSLHGLIIADAYKIPNIWIKLSDNIMGGEFKYLDYYASVNKAISILEFDQKEIDYDIIMSAISKYQSIDFNERRLLSTCPFFNNSI